MYNIRFAVFHLLKLQISRMILDDQDILYLVTFYNNSLKVSLNKVNDGIVENIVLKTKLKIFEHCIFVPFDYLSINP